MEYMPGKYRLISLSFCQWNLGCKI